MRHGTETALAGHVMVDSGQVMVGDPCYLKEFVNTDGLFMDLDSEGATKPPFGYSYEGASQASCSGAGHGELGGGMAVAASSGYGDGRYPVYVEKNGEGRVVALHVYFDEDPNSDPECPECGGGDCGEECRYSEDEEDENNRGSD
jgi:hypothetical protein